MPTPSSPPLVLASASPARLATLRSAGVEPRVVISGVDEDAVLAAARAARAVTPADAVLVLARAKAEDVAARIRAEATAGASSGADDGEPGAGGDGPGALVLGCDSMLELDGEVLGKPGTPEVARERWRAMRGRSGVLHTGHWLIDARTGALASSGATASTTVTFAQVSDDEIDAYVATGEPLVVAGAFTIDGLGGAFVERVEGDHHNVVGVSLPLVRRLLAGRGVAWASLWDAADPDPTATPAATDTVMPTDAPAETPAEMASRHVSVVVRRSAAEAYDFAADPDNLPRWAAGLSSGDLRRDGDDLVLASPMGEIRVRFAARNDLGILDHDVTLPDGTVVQNPLRVVPHPDGAEVVFTVRQLDLSDEELGHDAALVAADLATLKGLLEA